MVGVESHKRSIVKAITWRVIATATTLLVAYIWLGEWTTSIALALMANGIKAVLYYIRVQFGVEPKHSIHFVLLRHLYIM